jgi:L-asparaginase
MAKPKIAVFSGPRATVTNSPPLVTSNKARLPGEATLPGSFDHLVGQTLHAPVTVRIKKFSAHPLEEDAKALYHDNGLDYYEVELRPEDGPYLLPYMARRNDGSADGAPFGTGPGEDGRQHHYPDASRVFADINRTISGRNERGVANSMESRADYDFIRVLPPGGYTQQGEVPGIDFFSSGAPPFNAFPSASGLAKVANMVNAALASGEYAGGLWLEGSPTVEETLYWLSLLVGTDLPIAGAASQRPHGQLANDGDRNLVDAVDYILSGKGIGVGAVGVLDEQIFSAREFKKADDRPGNYKATGGHGGVLGTVGPPVTLWYRPAYKHTATSDVRLDALPTELEFLDAAGDTELTTITIKDKDGMLLEDVMPRVHITKYGAYMAEDAGGNPESEVDILSRVVKGLGERTSAEAGSPRLHGFVLEGASPYAFGTEAQMAALTIAAYSGFPVVKVGRADPGGRVPSNPNDAFIEGSNLDTNKARLLLMASMLKFGRLPRAADPLNPTPDERSALLTKIAQFQEIFETH